jgi:hypothetical protein
MRTCEACGETFEPNRMGRPRRFCRLCRPVTEADRQAALERAGVAAEERRRVNRERLRAGSRAMRERIRARRVGSEDGLQASSAPRISRRGP